MIFRALFALALLASLPAHAVGPDERLVAKVAELSEWIEANTDYSLSRRHDLPIFLFVSPPELAYAYAGNVENGAANTAAGLEPVALYNTGHMLLREDFDPDRDSQVLLHELVHHFQHYSGRKFRCVGEREEEAYRLQEQYAAEIGEPARVPNGLARLLFTACGGD